MSAVRADPHGMGERRPSANGFLIAPCPHNDPLDASRASVETIGRPALKHKPQTHAAGLVQGVVPPCSAGYPYVRVFKLRSNVTAHPYFATDVGSGIAKDIGADIRSMCSAHTSSQRCSQESVADLHQDLAIADV